MRFGYSPGWGGLAPRVQYLQQTGQTGQFSNWLGVPVGAGKLAYDARDGPSVRPATTRGAPTASGSPGKGSVIEMRGRGCGFGGGGAFCMGYGGGFGLFGCGMGLGMRWRRTAWPGTPYARGWPGYGALYVYPYGGTGGYGMNVPYYGYGTGYPES